MKGKEKTITAILREAESAADSIDYERWRIRKLLDEIKGRRLTKEQQREFEDIESYLF